MIRAFLFWALTGICLLACLPASAQEPVPLEATVTGAPAADGASIQLRFNNFENDSVVETSDPSLRQVLKQFSAGDQVVVTVNDPRNPKNLLSAAVKHIKIAPLTAIASVVLSTGALLLLIWMLGASPLGLVKGEDGRFSKSKIQMGLWFLAVFSTYLGITALRVLYLGGSFLGGVNIPTNLLLLTGLSAFTFGAAKAVTSQKMDNAANAQAPTTPAVPLAPGAPAVPPVPGAPAVPAATPKPKSEDAKMGDLFKNDGGDFDLGDTQMMVITFLVVILFVGSGVVFLQDLTAHATITMPDVDTTLLSIFGLGQGAYLFKKMASKPGDG
ncbi:hypothetical protein [Rhizobium leguminosarum]|uniref:hypothetical protein n=1 Tax=Rhizobium leguminosarum TaxID=384 RepID=UPI0019540EA8|nr:hypothetical protein [Rhizobium leguminosarum]